METRINLFDAMGPAYVRPSVGHDHIVDHDQFNVPQSESEEPEPGEGCLRTIVIAILLLTLLTFLCGCRSSKSATVVIVRDSIRTEVRTETITVHDTVPVALPGDSIAVVTPPDTTSHIETSVAISEAAIRDGLLWHSIWNKPTVDVPVEHTVTVRDSTVYREKEVPVPYPVEVEVEKPLTWWQQLRIWLGNILLVAILAAAGYGIFRLWRKIQTMGLMG